MPSLSGPLGVTTWNAGRSLLVGLGTLLLPHRRVSGMSLVAVGKLADPAALFDKLTAAVSLIQRYDPRRGARLSTHLRRVLIVPSGAELYDHGIQAYFASAELLRARPLEAVALALVHESTHGWFHARGIVDTLDRVDRIERLCIGQEIAFAKRLPTATTWVSLAEDKLSRPWWGPREGEKRLDALSDALHLPHWLRRVRARLFGRQTP